ncbi:hypothetical protein AJ80_06361 [Polytolypa hystricis UAMH7299]|uniref:Zn(2)-C6 fungal-type domain-containing protein n=1 Tax=Polytolypa hystricis (strain UAMH7299) TaxID=1447883 RepID=A0A2B7XY18_POLH7|nr:hypothetical protein AJ80_06361 [Polytolypa hystricis UAMH7299]
MEPGQTSTTSLAETVPRKGHIAKGKPKPLVSIYSAPLSTPKAVAANGPNINKPKQSKSRNGCVTCKAKRLKCDETKPTCQQCHRRNVTCGGYKKDFKWRSFEESSFANKHASKGLKVVTSRSPVASPITVPKQLCPKLGSPESARHDWMENNVRERQCLTPASDGDVLFPICSPHPRKLSFMATSGTDGSWDNRSSLVLTPESSLGWRSPALSSAACTNIEEAEEFIQSPVTSTGRWNIEFSSLLLSEVPRGPNFGPGSPEMLIMRFVGQTCGILSVKDGRSENPWRTLIWPLAKESLALYHAICSLAAFHCAKENPLLRVQGVDHANQSFRLLRRGLSTMRTDAALATTLALVFVESWDRHVSTGIRHVRGAKALLSRASVEQQHVRRHNEHECLRFLYNTWVYTDVIARLVSLDDSGLDNIAFPPISDTNIHEIDPLMGCATTLFPLISRVANLVQKVRVRQAKENSIAIISEASELKTQIENWEAPKYFKPPEDPTSHIQDSFQTAQAYRWATLLYLHQAVPEIPSESSAELAKRVLQFLATVPLSSRTTIVHIYPLLVASCEAESEEYRIWVQERWAAMQTRLMIGNIDRCLEVIKEVWERRDAHEMSKLGSQQPILAIPLVDSRQSDFPLEEGEPDLLNEGSYISLFNFQGEELIPVLGSSLTPAFDTLEFEKTVRGRLHWLGVMRDWGWEGMWFSFSFCEPSLIDVPRG